MKRSAHVTLILTAVVLIPATAKLSTGTEKDSAPTSTEIRKWIGNLGSDSFQIREEAMQSLIKAGKPALSAVTKAVSHKDPEVRTRASTILFRILESADAKTVRSTMRTVARSTIESSARSRAMRILQKEEHEQLLGLWRIVSTGQNGKAVQVKNGNQFFFIGMYVYTAEESPIFGNPQIRNEFTVNPVTDPQRFDCWERLGIYRKTGDTLKICLSSPADRTRPKSFTTSNGDGRYVVELKRFDPFDRSSHEFKRQRRAVASLKKLRGEQIISLEPEWLSGVLSDFRDPQKLTNVNLTFVGHLWIQREFGRPSGFNLHRVRDFDSALPHLRSFSNLKQLKLSTPKVLDRHLKHIRHLKGLQRLNLYYASVTDAGISELNQLKELREIQLGYTDISDQALAQIKNFTNLQILGLLGVKITDLGIQHLKDLTNLRKIDLSRTGVTDAGLKHLQVLSKLEDLDVSQTAVTASGIQELKRALPNCLIRR